MSNSPTPKSLLTIVTNPDHDSLTWAVANRLTETLSAEGAAVEVGDLYAEGFNPSYSNEDLAYYRGGRRVPADVLAEQRRVEESDALVLVFPMYWWSVPALLKGWLDRVFTRSWGYRLDAGDVPASVMNPLKVHLVAIAATSGERFERNGYANAFETQIVKGIFGYCDIDDVHTHLFSEAETPGAATGILSETERLARSIVRPRANRHSGRRSA